MTPRQLLDAADQLLECPPECMSRCWQRTCATLTRAALEEAIHQLLRAYLSNGGRRPRMRALLLVLPQLADPGIAATARTAWYGLCGAVHHHAYELAPTAGELRNWHREVTAVVAQLEARMIRRVAPAQ